MWTRRRRQRSGHNRIGHVQIPVQIGRLEGHIGTWLVQMAGIPAPLGRVGQLTNPVSGRFRKVGQLTNREFDAVPGTFDTSAGAFYTVLGAFDTAFDTLAGSEGVEVPA